MSPTDQVSEAKMVEWEQERAYEGFCADIESACLIVRDDIGGVWFDLATSEHDLSDARQYLRQRGWPIQHPTIPSYVSFTDFEPMPVTEVLQ
jgi:hypothetical protein